MFLNMKLLAQHTLNGFGGMGEGMSMQLARDGRRVLWLAHESAPKNFTAVDVTDPRAPKVIVQTDLPHAQMRSNSLEVAGDLMAVAYQVTKFGLKPAGFELFDVSEPERPRSVSFFDASGPHSRGCHQLWFVDGKTVHMACADPELKPRNPKDDQVYRIVDVSDPARPRAVGRWHLPGTMEGDDAPPPQRFAYAGGSGTLPFIGMLAQGGDELLLIDQRYSVPLLRVSLGAFGSPVLQLRHRIGAAGLGSLPTFEQMVGLGVSLTVIRGEFQFDPATQRGRVTAGFTFSR